MLGILMSTICHARVNASFCLMEKSVTRKLLCVICFLTLGLSGVVTIPAQNEESDLRIKIARFAPTEITADISTLSPNDRKALDKIIAAARLFDPLYIRQVWSGNEALHKKLMADKSPLGRERLHYFEINKGPWSQLDDNAAFIAGVPATRPPQAAHYPDDMTKDEFTKWVDSLSPAEKAKATGFFYAIRRGPDKRLMAVPYSEVYREFLVPAAKLLNEAAALTSNATLKDFLTKRAKAFMSDDYYESDVAWMDLDAPIDVTIGPYETYSDELFSYKAAFEAYVTIRDETESNKLKRFSQHLQDLEDHLPIDAKYRNPKLGSSSPMRVVNVVFSSGEGNSGVQTAAFNLPNDEKVVAEKGSKRVLLKNIQHAKFDKTLVPISKVALSKADQADLSFEAFFTHILMHELMHGLGPHNIKVNGADTTVRAQLKNTYSMLEEAKADISGLWALQYLVDKGVLDKGLEKTMYKTFLASCFRSVRFGINEAHGRGVAVQFNYLTDEGGFSYDPKTETFSVVPSRIKDAVRKLTTEIMTIQAEGSYEKAKAMSDKFGVIRPEMKAAFEKLKGVPVDIEPIFPLAVEKK
jgi:hypothetical protein